MTYKHLELDFFKNIFVIILIMTSDSDGLENANTNFNRNYKAVNYVRSEMRCGGARVGK